jgi:transposase
VSLIFDFVKDIFVLWHWEDFFMSDLHRHDIDDEVWVRLKPHLFGSKGNRVRRGLNNRLFLNAVLWKLRTGCPWRDLPPCYGNWKSVSNRFYRWRDANMWEKLLALVSGEPDLEWLMIDATHIKVHPHAAGAKGGTQI